MGIFRRVSDIISANLNDLVDRFEDPEKGLKQAIREMEETIDAATAAAAKAIASEKLMAKELAEHERRAGDWLQRAEQAVQAGNDDLARQSLRRKHEHEKLADALDDQSLLAQETSQRLRRQVEAMRAKLAEARRKLATLVARSRMAHARKRLQTVGTVVQFRTDAFSKFDRMREKVELAEAEVDALVALHSGEEQAVQLEFEATEEERSIQAELAALKKKAQETNCNENPNCPRNH
ncbi:MAG: PspA/IM30 family protein [Planctomycetes bacterium]|nr:PspA/IM30 family protein [Planctomycetota bacterium]